MVLGWGINPYNRIIPDKCATPDSSVAYRSLIHLDKRLSLECGRRRGRVLRCLYDAICATRVADIIQHASHSPEHFGADAGAVILHPTPATLDRRTESFNKSYRFRIGIY